VPLGITDPVQSARAELKAALAALEEKANIPRRASEAADQKIRDVRESAQRNPGAAAALVAGVAGLVGFAVWGIVRAYTR
jgi:ferric-dicitrate binding protein FerR (iron transport regulator)